MKERSAMHSDRGNPTHISIDAPSSRSLKLLLPRWSNPAVRPKHNPLTRFIEDTSINIVAIAKTNNSNQSGYPYLHPDHTSVLDNNGLPAMRNLEINGRDGFIGMRAELKICNPDIHLEVSNVTSTVEEFNGTATVYLTGRLSRFLAPDTKPREAVTILEWKRLPGYGWMCTHSRFMHGFADVPVSLEYVGDG